jgi:hypothetical protein
MAEIQLADKQPHLAPVSHRDGIHTFIFRVDREIRCWSRDENSLNLGSQNLHAVRMFVSNHFLALMFHYFMLLESQVLKLLFQIS